MVILTNDIKRRLKRLSLSTDNLFSEDIDLTTLTKTIKINKSKQKYNKSNYDLLMSQIPDGIYNSIESLISIIESVDASNNTKHITYSPLRQKNKAFDACKKLSYNKGNVITGRDDEIEQILLTLARRNKRGLILVGEPGTGKTAIVREINTRLINGNVPLPLKGCTIHNLDIPWIFTHYKEDPLSKIVDVLEAANTDPKHILFIDEVHQLLNEKFNDILKPYLTESIRFIGSTTTDEYFNIVTEDKAIERRFTLVNIKEPDVYETTEMVNNTKKTYETFHNCSITTDICKYVVENGSRFLGHRKNPDKSFDILDKACSIMNIKDIKEVSISNGNPDFHNLDTDYNHMKNLKLVSEERVLAKRHIDMAISDIAGIDYDYIKNGLDYNHIVSELSTKIINQDSAIKELANISNIMKHINFVRNRPISIILIVGTHGVGKSATVNELGKQLYGNTDNVIEYDLSEYKSEFQLTELKGAPPGYVGYQKSGKLIKSIRNNPQSIVYFKHINKCHESIAEYLLTSIKNGKLTDSAEREVSLNNTIIIFSVSLEEKDDKIISKGNMGFSSKILDETKRLEKIVNKDILNAVDTIIKFNNLSSNDLDLIFDANLETVLNMYNKFDIDKKKLKQEVFAKDCKTGHDVINNLTSIVPKMIFNNVSEI